MAVLEGRRNAAAAGDDVAVGERITVGREDDARAGAAAPIVALDLEVKNGRPDLLHRADDGTRIGVKESQLVSGRPARFRGRRPFDGVDR